MLTSGWAEMEFAGAELADRRFRRNLVSNLEALTVRSEASFSGALGHAGRQAMRRLLQREEQTVEGLLAGHVAETARRASAWEVVLAPQDMTPLDYSSQGSRSELGPFNGGAKEHYLLLHSQVAVSPTGLLLGVLGMELWTRDRATVGRRATRKQRPVAEKESARWRRGVERVEAALPATQRVVAISDAEGDVYDHLSVPRRPQTHLLVRAAQDRVVWVNGERRRLFGTAAAAPVVATLQVTIPRQAGKPSREAVLTVRETAVRIAPPGCQRPAGVAYRVIRAAEETPEEGVKEPVEWVLLTTLDKDLEPSAGRVIEYYTKRWVIEEWHFTLKSGQQVERLQVEGLEPLKKAVALLGVAAWQVQYLTKLARQDPERPAEEVLSPDELAVLRAVAPKPVETVWSAVCEIARLVGYQPYRNAPPPGVKRMWQGLLRLHAMLDGWHLARGLSPGGRCEA